MTQAKSRPTSTSGSSAVVQQKLAKMRQGFLKGLNQASTEHHEWEQKRRKQGLPTGRSSR